MRSTGARPTPPLTPPTSGPAFIKAGQKRPLGGHGTVSGLMPAAVMPNTGHKTIITVAFKGTEDKIGINTLVGEYTEVGLNHGRKTFKRTSSPSNDKLTVFLYYWDKRDGAAFSGWWFGDRVGGAQVWSRCEQDAQMPPSAGWRIPWDGAVVKELVVDSPKPPAATMAKIEAKEEMTQEKIEAQRAKNSAEAALDPRVQKATDRVVLAEIEATQALESASAMMEGEVSDENLKVVQEMLHAQQEALTEVHRELAADIIESRKRAPKTVMTLRKLTPRLRCVQASVVQEIQGAQQIFSQKRQDVAEKKKRDKQEERQAQTEQRNAKELEAALPVVMDIVSQTEDAIEAVATAAASLAVEAAEEMSEKVEVAIKDTEVAAAKAQTSIVTARKELSQRVSMAQQFAPDAKKVALSEFSALQEKLTESQRRLSPYLNVRQNFELKLKGKKVLTDITSRLAHVDDEVNRVTSLLKEAEPPAEEIQAAEAKLSQVTTNLATAMMQLERTMQNTEGPLREGLLELQERGKASKNKLDHFRTSIKSHLDQLLLFNLLEQGLDKTQQAEDALQRAVLAGVPLADGFENMLPFEVATVLAASEEAEKAAEVAAAQAKSFLKNRLAEAKRFSEVARKSTLDELSQLQDRAEVVSQKAAGLKRATALKKCATLLEEVVRGVADTEAEVQRVAKLAEPLALADHMEVASLREAAGNVLSAEKAAALVVAESRQSIAAKQKNPLAKESSTYVADLARFDDKMVNAQQSLAKIRKTALQADRMCRNKQVAESAEADLRQAESDMDRMEMLTTPLGDERVPVENVRELAAGVDALQKALNEIVVALVEASQSSQGQVKSTVARLISDAKKAEQRFKGIKAETQEPRQRLKCEEILAECREKLADMDKVFEQVAEAEVPYLKGIDLPPGEEAAQAVADSVRAADAAHDAVNSARAFLTAKSLEMKSCVPVVAKFALEEVSMLARKVEDASERLSAFKRDTEGRKRLYLNQEARAKVELAEEAVQKTSLAALSLNVGDVAAEDAADMCDKLQESEQETRAALNEARTAVEQRRRDVKNRQPDAADMAQLNQRVKAVEKDLNKAKATVTEHEQRLVANLVLQEARDLVKSLNSELACTTAEAAPLISDSGEAFEAASITAAVVEALDDYASANTLSRDDIFGLAGGVKGKLGEVEFTAFLEKLGDLCSRPDLVLSPTQRFAVFEQLDADVDGTISRKEFDMAFRQRFVCKRIVALSETFEGVSVSGSPDVKLAVGDVVEALGEPRPNDSMGGVLRQEVKALKDGASGWVTLQGNHGTMNLEPFTKYGAFIRALDSTISSAENNSEIALGYIDEKIAELRDCTQGPLVHTRSQLAALRPEVGTVQLRLDQLRQKVDEGKREHAKREQAAQQRAEEKKERVASTIVLKAIGEKTEAAKVALQALAESAMPLMTPGELEKGVAEKPIAKQKDVDSHVTQASAAIVAALESLAAQAMRVARIPRGPWADASNEMSKMQAQLSGMKKKVESIADTARSALENLAAAKTVELSVAIRKDLQKRKLTLEALYSDLSAGSVDELPEANLAKYLEGLKGISVTPEQRKLCLGLLAAGGLSRRGFFELLEKFYVCVKDTALTADFEIKESTKTIRRLEIGEIVEVVDGPKLNDSLGVSRVSVRCLQDGREGWATVRGNQGTPFLQDTSKPCYYVTQAQSLQSAFATESAAEIREMQVDEVVDVLEGPKRETPVVALRARAKAASDGKVGWFTLRSKHNETFAEQGKKSYTVTNGIALTDGANITECKVLKKLDAGETLVLMEGPTKDASSGLERIRVTIEKDGSEGWITIKGNAGSVYAVEDTRNYVITKKVPLQPKKTSDTGTAIRVLEIGEAVELLEDPREEKSEALLRIRCRAVSDGKVGWLNLAKGNLKPWSPHYRCTTPAPLQDSLQVSDAKTKQHVKAGETLELLQGPKIDFAQGVLRMKCKVAKGGAVGWMTLSDKGKRFVECVPQQ